MDRPDEDKNEANAMLAGGATVAALGLLGALVSGAICPVCVIAAPALIGIGAARKIRAARRAARAPLKNGDGARRLRGTRSS
jgi:hypothetical protein